MVLPTKQHVLRNVDDGEQSALKDNTVEIKS